MYTWVAATQTWVRWGEGVCYHTSRGSGLAQSAYVPEAFLVQQGVDLLIQKAMTPVLFVLASAHFAWPSAASAGEDSTCALQKRWLQADVEQPGSLAPLGTPVELARPAGPAFEAGGGAAWSTPGVRFQQCARPAPQKLMASSILQGAKQTQAREEKPLPNRVSCPPGQMPIGNFAGDAYDFTCCDAAEQCGGCRKIKDGLCQECAAGYVHQKIPILNITKCFLCESIPDWQDSKGLTCQDYESKGYCRFVGDSVEDGHDQAFHGLRPSEACCACGGGSVQPTPSSMSLARRALVNGDPINDFPEPQPLGTEVSGCDLATWQLQLEGSGRIHGNVEASGGKSQATEIKCSLVLMEDPMRGLFTTVDLQVPVGVMSYGDQVLVFKYWGLEPEPANKAFPVHVMKLPSGHTMEKFQLHCNCPRLGAREALFSCFFAESREASGAVSSSL